MVDAVVIFDRKKFKRSTADDISSIGASASSSDESDGSSVDSSETESSSSNASDSSFEATDDEKDGSFFVHMLKGSNRSPSNMFSLYNRNDSVSFAESYSPTVMFLGDSRDDPFVLRSLDDDGRSRAD